MIATKEQEIKALQKIREIITTLGEDNHVATAFDGCIEIAEENIEFDFACSMKNKYETAVKELEQAKQTVKQLENKVENLSFETNRLEHHLERELEWKPYIDKRNVSQNDYECLAGTIDTRFLSDDEAIDLVGDWFGFAKDKIKIIRTVNAYEINRHNQLRKVGVIERNPVYNATDWNYIIFECSGVKYEIYNDQINVFID